MSIDLPVLRSVLHGAENDFCVWEPKKIRVIMGRGGREEEDVISSNCIRDGIPVIRRRTGGGTVVLSPGVLVFSLACIVEKELVIREYARQVNGLIIEFLRGIFDADYREDGISDVCIGNRKIMGSGMYRRRNILFFQGSILVDPDLSLMDKYLKPPIKQPEYRNNRTHGDFVTTLKKEGMEQNAFTLAGTLHDFLDSNIYRIF
jgi:lipoate-protein ligase A